MECPVADAGYESSTREQREENEVTNLRNDSRHSKQKPNNTPLCHCTAIEKPAKRNNRDGLDVADYGTAHSTGLVDDVELGYVDGACAEPTLRAR